MDNQTPTWASAVTALADVREALADFQEGKLDIADCMQQIAKAVDYKGRCSCGLTLGHTRECPKFWMNKQ